MTEFKEIKVLDKGFVRLVDVMGSDQRIVQSARVSYGEGTKTVREDRGLIRYLVRNKHTSPLEQVQFTFHCKAPIFIARQWMRHRTAKLNEVSGRYSMMKDEFYVPEIGRMQKQSADNKQGSGRELIQWAEDTRARMEAQQTVAHDQYSLYLRRELAKEVARINLPLSLYTEWYWTIDLHNLFHFLQLRLDPHAQYEIRVYAQAIYDMIKEHVPLACEAFEDYILKGQSLSRMEWAFIRKFLPVYDSAFRDLASEFLGGSKSSDFKEFWAKVSDE